MTVATYAAAQLLRALPRIRITRAVGRLAEARIPAAMSRAVVGAFVRAYDVALDEAEDPSATFESFDAFFTRKLASGQRPLEGDEQTLVSPADGRLDAFGPVEPGGRLLVKDRPYTAAELLGDEGEAERYRGGSFGVVYLSPRDYHRVHAPIGGKIATIRSLPGDLFPVNAIGERHVPRLFAINRRVVIPIDSEQRGRVTVVMVGAMIVGRISVPFIDARDVPEGNHHLEPTVRVERGGEIGVFHLGSTAVLFTEPGVPAIERALGSVRLGEALHPAPSAGVGSAGKA